MKTHKHTHTHTCITQLSGIWFWPADLQNDVKKSKKTGKSIESFSWQHENIAQNNNTEHHRLSGILVGAANVTRLSAPHRAPIRIRRVNIIHQVIQHAFRRSAAMKHTTKQQFTPQSTAAGEKLPAQQRVVL